MSTLQRDLPELWQKPTYDELRDSLENLHVKPPVWDYHLPLTGAVALHNSRPQDRRDINQFITSIISSNLTWIDDEDQREELWTLASKRLSERCGRTAMGEITRRFSFQGHQGTGTPPFDLIIREPPITGESLGLKTWASSYILAQILPGLATAPGGLSHVGELQKDAKPRILELGSGTGLLGLAASCFWHTSVTLTDVPTIVPNLAFNVETNRVVVEEVMGGSIEAASLTWGNHAETDVRFHVPHQYDLVIAADAIYDDDHPTLLAGAIHEYLSPSPSARALVMVPLRDQVTHKLVSAFQEELLNQRQPLQCVEESMMTGRDDWGEAGEGQEVSCWWAIIKKVVLDTDLSQ